MFKATYISNTHCILYIEKIKPDEHCFARLVAAMEQFSLDVAYPLEPNHARGFGIYECNQVRIGTGPSIVQPLCVALKWDIYQKFATLGLPELIARLQTPDIKQGLVCNALIYA